MDVASNPNMQQNRGGFVPMAGQGMMGNNMSMQGNQFNPFGGAPQMQQNPYGQSMGGMNQGFGGNQMQ